MMDLGTRYVYLYPKRYGTHAKDHFDVLDYLKKYRENLLCVKLQKVRKGDMKMEEIKEELRKVVESHDDIFVDNLNDTF